MGRGLRADRALGPRLARGRIDRRFAFLRTVRTAFMPSFRLVAQPNCLPPMNSHRLGVGGYGNPIGYCPCQLLLRAEAAAVPPALLGALAATGVVLTRERLATVLAGDGGERQTNGGD